MNEGSGGSIRIKLRSHSRVNSNPNLRRGLTGRLVRWVDDGNAAVVKIDGTTWTMPRDSFHVLAPSFRDFD